MKAISLWQPWASAIAAGSKRLETRSWAYPVALQGQLVAIHAAKRWSPGERAWAKAFEGYGIDLGFERGGTPPLGAVVAVARLAECLPVEKLFGSDPLNPRFDQCVHGYNHFCPEGCRSTANNSWVEYHLGNYGPGRYAWRLTDVVALEKPIPCKGLQQFWDVPREVVQELRAQGVKA